MTRFLLLLGLSLSIASCSSVDVARYADQQPALSLEHFFSQPVKAWGMFQKRNGEVTKRFEVDLVSRREGNNLILDERFVYSDGTHQRRIWTLTPEENGRWSGRAGDVVGVAKGQIAGNTFHWRYRLNLPVDDSTYEVSMDDWMYLIDEDTLINRTSMSKWGVEVGQVTVFFRRQSAGAKP
ncbi:DUF3833 domain-containing protein [Pseudomonas moraviensis]|uniref:DUF3833 domain-containing protein n=1 Tax=Pseudomonas moraviensis TaxID=321662 RepID=UPI00215EBDB1|nr:DUF3833 domain-containing protein [Pseudomonas moraviensis]UVL43732.1 DUF3833 domain-containing protein [Pseudomonas moraviensis]